MIMKIEASKKRNENKSKYHEIIGIDWDGIFLAIFSKKEKKQRWNFQARSNVVQLIKCAWIVLLASAQSNNEQ